MAMAPGFEQDKVLQKGLRGCNSPMCTLSQNGYGDRLWIEVSKIARVGGSGGALGRRARSFFQRCVSRVFHVTQELLSVDTFHHPDLEEAIGGLIFLSNIFHGRELGCAFEKPIGCLV